MAEHELETWDLWYPNAAAAGLPFARCRIEPQSAVLVHAPPPVLRVEVRDGSGAIVAAGDQLDRTDDRPMALLQRRGDTITRTDLWPDDSLLGTVVILPGGEAGVLVSWWNAPEGDEWRWRVEFYNHR